MTTDLIIREYKCPDCGGGFWVNDELDEPCYCPFCGNKQYDAEPEHEQPMRFFKNPIANRVDLYVLTNCQLAKAREENENSAT